MIQDFANRQAADTYFIACHFKSDDIGIDLFNGTVFSFYQGSLLDMISVIGKIDAKKYFTFLCPLKVEFSHNLIVVWEIPAIILKHQPNISSFNSQFLIDLFPSILSVCKLVV